MLAHCMICHEEIVPTRDLLLDGLRLTCRRKFCLAFATTAIESHTTTYKNPEFKMTWAKLNIRYWNLIRTQRDAGKLEGLMFPPDYSDNYINDNIAEYQKALDRLKKEQEEQGKLRLLWCAYCHTQREFYHDPHEDVICCSQCSVKEGKT